MPLIVPGITVPKTDRLVAPTTSANFIPALIVVDMQNDFVTGSLAVPDAQSIIEPINSILALPFAVKIGTKDFHPPDHISFASNHQKSVGEKITIYPPGSDPQSDSGRGIEQVLWPNHCVQSTPGADFVEGLHDSALDAVVYKGTHKGIECYSAFRDPWRIATTELCTLLSERGVTDVFVVGLAGDYCVKSTAIDAVQSNFKTWVVRDLVRSVGKDGKEWGEMQTNGVLLVESDEVKQTLQNEHL
jgi:nicotinamidase